MSHGYDALLVVSFGGPEKGDEVMPFLENVTRGRGIPRDRLIEVAQHYMHFGGRSPINDQNRALIAALRDVVRAPIYWGNRNWAPYLADTVRQMRSDGVRHAAAFITSVFGSYSGCRQYLEDIARAREQAGEGAPEISALRMFHTHHGFIKPLTENVSAAMAGLDEQPHVAFTAHSVPVSMAESSPYVRQLAESCSLIVSALELHDWALVYQSRSGPPQVAWLEPDILQHIANLHERGRRELVIAPIGFISDHIEVIYDLDTEAAALCAELGIRMVRAKTVDTHPDFVRMIAELMHQPPRVCAPDCCPPPVIRSGRRSG
ncbi:MAG TPA: ferrochelatase [Bryobacteraceae bacterium]|nr:ferrochelatase [Bryobacteraceae bacterium]